ncbi:preprotein translocase subunit SecA [bacterium]|nr:MAG: preprotein translocase subunit SecA [bacterium]
MVFNKILGAIVKSKKDRDVKRMLPLLEEVKALREQMQALDDSALKAKTDEYRGRIADGETVDDLLPEAFATVWEACYRLNDRQQAWDVMGEQRVWDMVPYDVQIIGGISLHQGRIAEMATGEGKTLVATMPIYLNALTGRGVHLITVNDYLAQRDSEWMGGIYSWLGLSVGSIRSQMTPEQRRESYACDITYGTNNEFGFDYLRDNMAVRVEDLVQRDHHYAIVDEVDSVLVDEARTPLIISGPVAQTKDRYAELRPPVANLLRLQTRLANDYLADIERTLKAEAELTDDHGLRLLQVSRGAPKLPRFMKLLKEFPKAQALISRTEANYMRDKAMWEADQDLYFIIEEKQRSVDLTEKGHKHFNIDDPDFFVLPDLSVELGRVESDEAMTVEEKAESVEELHKLYGERNEGIHAVQTLLKAYTLFEKDDEYVVQDGQIMIVDEFTGRIMHGRRYSDGLHSALEAKEGVTIHGETQTYATITLQNYFRMYDKLAGMTGTAETEASEFHEIYALDVMVIPTNRDITRDDRDDLIFRTKREKYNAIVEEIKRLNGKGLPILVGTTTVEVSETISRMLRRQSIRHNVLNAKQHASEAQIVAEAGQRGAVTIATNMAGRGTDIKLGAGVLESGDDEDCAGLQIIGSERHESRRIDRQLRGRAGRQGDPGSSQFFLSLEDDLMRLFAGIDRISGLMDRMKVEEGEVITHSMVTKAIERAQKRVEGQNFSIRKRLLDYDDVMNKQREVVYTLRRDALMEDDVAETLTAMIEAAVEDIVDENADESLPPSEWDWEGLSLAFGSTFLARLDVGGVERKEIGRQALLEQLMQVANAQHKSKEQRLGADLTRQLERHVILRTIDELWKDHLHELDLLRSGIGLRAYGQRDPLLEYKSESFKLFEEMMFRARRETVTRFFRLEIAAAPQTDAVMAGGAARKADAAPVASAIGSGASAAGAFDQGQAQKPAAQSISGEAPRGETVHRSDPKVGRNDPCPCGSGKKYKKCHGAHG